mgnify:CR=1 FL=1
MLARRRVVEVEAPRWVSGVPWGHLHLTYTHLRTTEHGRDPAGLPASCMADSSQVEYVMAQLTDGLSVVEC